MGVPVGILRKLEGVFWHFPIIYLNFPAPPQNFTPPTLIEGLIHLEDHFPQYLGFLKAGIPAPEIERFLENIRKKTKNEFPV